MHGTAIFESLFMIFADLPIIAVARMSIRGKPHARRAYSWITLRFIQAKPGSLLLNLCDLCG